MGSSDFVLAEAAVRSPRKSFIYSIEALRDGSNSTDSQVVLGVANVHMGAVLF